MSKESKCKLNHIPNEETIKAIEEAELGIDLHEVSSVEELFKELKEEDLDDTEEGDRILGEASKIIRKECKLISKEEFYKQTEMK